MLHRRLTSKRLHCSQIKVVMEKVLNDRDKDLHVSSNIRDNKEVNADSRDPESFGNELHNNAQAHADPHFANNVCWNHRVVAIWRLQEQNANYKRRCQNLTKDKNPNSL